MSFYHFAFTWNNPTNDVRGYLATLCEGVGVTYAVVGNETAPTTGTEHLQGHITFAQRKSLNAARTLLQGAHVERARVPRASIEYCKKGGDFVEYGDIKAIPYQGKRTDLDDYIDWVKTSPTYPTTVDIQRTFPNLWVRYSKRLLELRDCNRTLPGLESGEYRGWQLRVRDLIAEPADDRKIIFVVDENGGAGKSWFVRKYLTDNDDAQMIGVAKRDDMIHALDVSKRVIFIDVPRNSMQYLQYAVLEGIKNRLVFSAKYNSLCKQFIHQPHVVVFSNEEPDRNALTRDRYKIINIVNLN